MPSKQAQGKWKLCHASRALVQYLRQWKYRYKREDGIDLTATLYLPPKYNKDEHGPLPCILWAYPREFKSKAGTAIHTTRARLQNSSPREGPVHLKNKQRSHVASLHV